MTLFDLTELNARVQEIYGSLLGPAHGVVHVVSATRAPDGLLHVLSIGPHAPRSQTDFLVLQLCRARADAVLTTARILRKEPELSLSFTGPFAHALTQLRATLHPRQLTCAILTRSGDLPHPHPLFDDAVHKLVLCREDKTRSLGQRLGSRPDVEVLPLTPATPRAALALLRARGDQAISIEAGPSTVRELYQAPAAIDELWLSRAELPALDARAIGGALPPDDVLFDGLRCVADTPCQEESGPWRFQRYVRA
jgi:riboflavin biosynthesis pyrimidine reductase